MPKAVWNGAVVADSDKTVVVEGNHYFPPESVRGEYLQPSRKTTTCPWKGRAHYYTIEVDGRTNRDAAWYYPHPSAAAARIAGHVAFWHGVRVERSDHAEPGRGEHVGFLRRLLGASTHKGRA